MATSPLAVLGVSAALAGALLLGGASHWLYEKRTRMQRVRTATGKRAGRIVTAAAASSRRRSRPAAAGRARLHARLDRAALDHQGPRSSARPRKLLVSAGYRSRDAIVVFTFFKLVSPLVFLAGAALYVYGTDPIGKGPMLDAAAVMAAALFGSKLPDIVVEERPQEAARKHPQGAARTRSTCW